MTKYTEESTKRKQQRETNFEGVENSDGKRKTNITEYYVILRKVDRPVVTQNNDNRKDDKKE